MTSVCYLTDGPCIGSENSTCTDPNPPSLPNMRGELHVEKTFFIVFRHCGYPIRVLNLHEIVNDQIGDVPFMVTYCPLCDSAAVFDRRTPIGEREFGVSGLLYNSNVLMYDRGGQPESLWSQVLGEGVSGPATGLKLQALPMELTTWQKWKTSHPNTKVLAGNYQRNPYAGYFNTPKLMFPARPVDRRLPAKTPVLGVWTKDGQARAYPVTLSASADGVIRDLLGEAEIVIRIDRESNTMGVVEADPSLQWMNSFWFAWYAMHPHTDLFGDE